MDPTMAKHALMCPVLPQPSGELHRLGQRQNPKLNPNLGSGRMRRQIMHAQGASIPRVQVVGSQVLPPVIVEPGRIEATAKLGNTVVIKAIDPVRTTVSTSTPHLVELTQGYDDGSATFNPGARTLAPGTAIITVTPPDGSSYHLSVTISE